MKHLYIWTAVFSFVLFSILLFGDFNSMECVRDPECSMYLILSGGAISFPLSLVWFLVVNVILSFFEYHLTPGVGFLIAILGSYVAGYCQWFIVVPWLIKKYKNIYNVLKK
jgi:hypothetical protein